jgi:DNA-binding MarR family transcriptional regulator
MSEKLDQFVMVPYQMFDLVEEGILSLREMYLYTILKQYHPCRPSINHLARRMQVNVSTVTRSLLTLRQHGIITRQKGNSNGTANLYTILPPDKWKIQRIETD